MKKDSVFNITREKHLDHMTRVVPFIVAAYAIQCFFITKMGPISFAVDGLIFMGICLVVMIGCFIGYDLTHMVTFHEDTFSIKIKWLGYEQSVSYEEITSVEISEPGVSFASVHVTTKDGKNYGFFFVDDADKVKAWIDEKRSPKMQAAA